MRPVLVLLASIVVVLLIVPTVIVGSWRTTTPAPPAPADDIMIKLYVTSTKQLLSISLEEYVKGVVAAEMPANFHVEALKAQAVAARTYAVKRALFFGGKGCDAHPQADLCDNPAHCQAWLPVAELQRKWGMLDYQTYWKKVCQAVDATAGQILTYQGMTIDPLFHSTCGGHTEDAGDVWQKSFPYLVAKECAYCQHSPKLKTEQSYSLDNFLAAVRELDGSVAVTTGQLRTASASLSAAAKTASGRVKAVTIGGRTIPATTLRYALGLNSTNFTYKIEDNKITFTVIGYGHGVGLCQYGADGMAQAGKTYTDILRYYYQGAIVATI